MSNVTPDPDFGPTPYDLTADEITWALAPLLPEVPADLEELAVAALRDADAYRLLALTTISALQRAQQHAAKARTWRLTLIAELHRTREQAVRG